MVTNSKAHWDVAMEVADEGTVLLKNDGTLPLKQGVKVCLFGLGAGYLFGGSVFAKNNITRADGLEQPAQRR